MLNEPTSNPETLHQTAYSNVETIYVLASGALIRSRIDYERVKDLFVWLDKKMVLTELLHLRAMTEAGKQSILAIYEVGKTIKTFINLENDFHISDLQFTRP
jgi:hypothetical protein